MRFQAQSNQNPPFPRGVSRRRRQTSDFQTSKTEGEGGEGEVNERGEKQKREERGKEEEAEEEGGGGNGIKQRLIKRPIRRQQQTTLACYPYSGATAARRLVLASGSPRQA